MTRIQRSRNWKSLKSRGNDGLKLKQWNILCMSNETQWSWALTLPETAEADDFEHDGMDHNDGTLDTQSTKQRRLGKNALKRFFHL